MHPLIELTKPKITRLVLIVTGAGFFLGSDRAPDLVLLLHTLVGTALVASGTNALNQWWEREGDALMLRTKARPLPSGRLAAGPVAWMATACGALGVGYLLALVNGLTALLAALTLTSYVFLYTPLKRRSTLATVVGAVPGALPVVGGWTAAAGVADLRAWTLFAILFLWQIPHFLALAWLYRDDYRRGGIAIGERCLRDGNGVGREAAWCAGALLPVSLLPSILGVTGVLSVAVAVALGAAFVRYAIAMAVGPDPGRARRLFLSSVAYLPLLLVVMVVDNGLL